MDDDILVMVKVAERCNINCRYCYMYNGVDQSWQQRPKLLSEEHLLMVVSRLNEYHRLHPQARLTLEIHGGEPLLMGKARMKNFLAAIRRSLTEDELFICTQTNGVLLDAEWLRLFEDLQATVSISCDGPPAAHNAHRVDFNNNGTAAKVEDAIRLCLEYPANNVFNGVLAVADPNFDGADSVDYFHNIGVRNFDFLLPDANFFSPPKHVKEYTHEKMNAFLTAAFNRWIYYQDPNFRVRMFETFILGALGQRSELDAFGGDLSSILVVESDGSYRLLDVLSICEKDIAGTSLSVKNDTIQDFLTVSRKAYPGASPLCNGCPAFTSCGGGYLAHRFNGIAYTNPSFYCPVLYNLHRHIVSYLHKVDMPKEMALPEMELLEMHTEKLLRNYGSIARNLMSAN